MVMKMNAGMFRLLIFVDTEVSAVDDHDASTPEHAPPFMLIIY